MSITGVTYRYEFGIAIDQAGLNAISAGLRVSRPDLFTRSDTIRVKPAPEGEPPSSAHLLTIYAVVSKPIAFSLYPVEGLSTLPVDSMMEGKQTVAQIAKDGRGLLHQTVSTRDSQVVLTRLA